MKPEWLKVPLRRGENFQDISRNLRQLGLHTVCEEASCPNMSECWQARTATIMILGDTCTRGCRFCHIKTGNPGGVVDATEIQSTVDMIGLMNLRYVVLTSVDRDDLADHGAAHFAAVIRAIHDKHPATKVEALVPDFGGKPERMQLLGTSAPFVIAQNIETVRRLTRTVRDIRAGYDLTLSCLDYYKQNFPMSHTKSSLMVGLGESYTEIVTTLADLRSVGCDLITFGQYLQPTKKHLRVERFYTPQEFEELKQLAYEHGFKFVASGPLVRSSYKAADYLDFVEGRITKEEMRNSERLNEE